MKKIKIEGNPARRIIVTGKQKRKIPHELVANALGAACPTCGSSNPKELKKCSFCDALKCDRCDVGDDVRCFLCEDEDDG